MKTLIVYFSLTNNTKWMAETIQKQLPNSTVHAVELKDKPLKSRWLQMMFYGFKTTFYGTMPIKPSSLQMEDYEAVIIGSPVWVGNVPPPVKAFLKQYSLDLTGKKVAAFCSMGGEPSKFFKQLATLIPQKKLEATLALVEPLTQQQAENPEKIKKFVAEIADKKVVAILD